MLKALVAVEIGEIGNRKGKPRANPPPVPVPVTCTGSVTLTKDINPMLHLSAQAQQHVQILRGR